MRLLFADEAATEVLAGWLAQALVPGLRLYLSGDLGSGKTRFTRALLRGLEHTGRVRSPTFTLLEPYKLSKFTLYHFDFYRFSDKNEWRDAGFEELLSDPTAVCVVEWPEMAGGQLPEPDLLVRLIAPEDPPAVSDRSRAGDDESDNRRLVEIEACGIWARTWLGELPRLIRQHPDAGISLLPV